MAETPEGTALEQSYEYWEANHPGEGTGAYMMAVFPDRWKGPNAESNARRAYNKIVSGETTGSRIFAHNRQPWKPPKYLSGRTKTGRRTSRSRRAVKAVGMKGEVTYRVTVYYFYDQESVDYYDETGGNAKYAGDARSFNGYSQDYSDPSQEAMVLTRLAMAKDAQIMIWDAESPPKEGYIAERTEIVGPVPYVLKGTPVDLDNMFMEDYEAGMWE